MKELLAVLAAFGVLAGAATVAVETFGDRATFVPPPEAISESFIHETLTGRYARAKQYMAEPGSVSERQLRALEQRIEADVGEASDVEASVVSRDDRCALVTVRVSSSKGSHVSAYILVFRRGWKINDILTSGRRCSDDSA